MDWLVDTIRNQTMSTTFAVLQGALGAPFSLLNQILQLLSFTYALSSLITFFLKIVHFSYAETLSDSWLSKIFILFMFASIKIWDHWLHEFIYLNYFSSAIISLYMYDCCANIGESFERVRGKFRELILLLGALLFVGSTVLLIYLGKYTHALEETVLQGHSHMLAYIVVISLVMIIVNLCYSRTMLFSFLSIITINAIILTRHYVIFYSPTNTIFRYIPLQCLPYIIMALDAQAKEHEYNKRQAKGQHFENINYWLLKFCISFYVYTLLNERNFKMQGVYGLISLILFILKR